MSAEPHLRCRIGLHRWARFRREDPDLASPGEEAQWVSRCRYCGVERGSGVASMLAVTVALTVAGGLLCWLVSPVLGGLLLMGAVLGAGWTARARWLGTYTSRVEFRYRG